MNIIHDRYSILSLPIIAGLAGIANVGAVIAATPNDACALLAASQVSSALGASVGPGQPTIPNNATTCTWSEQGVPAGTERNVTVSLMTAKSFENGKTPLTGITKTPVSGIGDDACFQVRARSNPKWFRTGKTPESEQKDQGVDRALALEILKKL